MVENDYGKDIVGADAIGMRAIWLARTPAAGPASACADAVIPSMAELPMAVAKVDGLAARDGS